jgi:AcrR family transcriptional regulator
MDTIAFTLNKRLYVRDPQHTELGQKIISKSVDMIDKMGFEDFTFRKLAIKINSTEASIYRYFENKHRLLLYLISWYWSWMEYRIEKSTNSLPDAKMKLKACLRLIAEEKKYDPAFDYVNEEALHRIVMSELNKAYQTKWVDSDNRDGVFLSFKSLCKKIALFVAEANPKYPFPQALVSTLIITSMQQLFFADHLKSLTNIHAGKDPHEYLYRFLETLTFGALQI